jgi:hypothetical protein
MRLNIVLSMTFFFNSAISLGAEPRDDSDCYFQGKDNVKIVSTVKMSIKKVPISLQGPEEAIQQGRGYTNMLELVLKNDCTIGEMNQILRKLNACIAFTNSQDLQFSIMIPDPKSYEALQEAVKALKKEKCLLDVKTVRPRPAPASIAPVRNLISSTL